MTLRQYYAGLAMQGCLSGSTGITIPKDIAAYAVDAADALINELNKLSKNG